MIQPAAVKCPPQTLTPADAAASLGADLESGLSEEEVRRLLAEHGPNEISSGEPISPWKLLLRQFQDLMVIILVVACSIAVLGWILEGAQGLPADAIVIGAIVVLNAALGFVQEYRAEKTVEELKKMASTATRVVRGGRTLSVDQTELVPGDIVLLDEGDRVPADLLLFRAERLQVDESLLTGESTTVSKKVGPVAIDAPLDGRTGEVFAATVVTAGSGRGLVVATGAATQLGGIASSLSTGERTETPLERRLARLGRQVGWAVLALSLVIGGTLLIAEGKTDAPTLVHVLMFSVALAVAAVPEGLPAVLTISLSVGARRLASRQAVVRRMPAVETLGSVTTILTDKTGTLTHNQMTANQVLVDFQARAVAGRGYEAEGTVEGGPSEAFELLLASGVLASTADLQDDPDRGRQALGDPTEAALLVLAEKAGRDWRSLRREAPELSSAPFSSERRRSSTLRRFRGSLRLFVKGSLEALLERSRCVLVDGAEHELSAQDRERLLAEEAAMADRGLRALAFATREAVEGSAEEQETELTLLGLVAMGDPARAEVPEAIKRCRRAGIRVMMLTGDHPRTALAIAREIGLAEEDRVLTGPEVAELDDATLERELRACNVYARVSPQAKLRIVERLLSSGEVVAMTGDGVNDAPALRKVHVGVAMGSGTAVAVEASELVLLDDNFATIVTAVEGGRSVFANVQKFIAFLFSGNTGVVLALFVGTLLAGAFDLTWEGHVLIPLTAAQILWMNLVTDGAPAVAFALARPRESVLDDPPRHPEDPILSTSIWWYIAVTGSWVAFLLLLVLDITYHGGLLTVGHLATSNPEYARTAAFYIVVVTRLFNAMNFQSLPGSLFRREAWRDFYVPAACLFSWGLTIALVYSPPLRQLFDLRPLPLEDLALLTLMAPSVLVVGELWKKLVGARLSNRR
ncbi:MAG: cation-transporting P-type ATPase [Armatimonadetes bacterium]|nr:cation-transporting P-type ATPase [Armatimonadota bacterium]